MATLLITLFIIVCILLIIVVLLQKGRGGGLGAAFGGAGSGAFGTRTGDVFTWVTIVLTGLFLILAALVMRPDTAQVTGLQVTPASGPQEEAVVVTMRCLTAGSSIHYTLDGSEPTEESPRYEKPLTIPLGKQLNARAFRTDWEPSEIVTREYTKALPATQPEGDGATAPTLPPVSTPDAPAAEPVTPPATTPDAPATEPVTTPDATPAKKAG